MPLFSEFDVLGLDNRRVGTDIDIDPIDATFRDSARAPLHSWYPYLEGYSPRFVESVRAEYMPNAQRIIEPFAGSGTTPIVLAQAGIECAYAEANPAMAFVIKTKLAVLQLTQIERRFVAERLRQIAGKLKVLLKESRAAEDLRTSYTASFGNSVFYEPKALDAILRLRGLNDELAAEAPAVADCFTLAVLAILIPTSLLKRAGDLRFKTAKELALGSQHPAAAVAQRLESQAADLLSAERILIEPTFACNTAGDLGNNLDSDWDGVITSPPYLNGTNYIRNARLELWYLRYVKEKSDLRRLRDKVITSGINDVDAQTKWHPKIEGVRRVVEKIQANAYDERIAKMVGGYFHDMEDVLRALRSSTRQGARVCIDIGDSIYGGVHVPTDGLLVELAESMGFVTLERMHLRKRISKSGAAVRQQLLVFESASYPARKPVKAKLAVAEPSGQPIRISSAQSQTPAWRDKWANFKRTLPHQIQPFSKREWGGPAHSMCSYQGKMKAALAHHLIECFSVPGDVVVDPFSGAGTIPFEACRMGREGFGIDISELGHVLTLGKVGKATPRSTATLLKKLEAYIESYQLTVADTEQASAVQFNSAVPDYFHPDTFREVVAARRFFLEHWNESPAWGLLFASTLHLLHGNRPYALSRRSHPVTPFAPTGPFEYRALMPRLREKLARMSEALTDPSRQYGGSVQADCTQTWPSSIPQADVIITSPPFFDSTRFYMTNWMRFWFVGWDREDFNTRAAAYVETRQKKDLDVYKDLFGASRERLKEGGLLVLHLGQSPKCDMGVELARRVDSWFDVVDCFTEDVEHCESHGVRDKGTVSGHTYLVLAGR